MMLTHEGGSKREHALRETTMGPGGAERSGIPSLIPGAFRSKVEKGPFGDSITSFPSLVGEHLSSSSLTGGPPKTNSCPRLPIRKRPEQDTYFIGTLKGSATADGAKIFGRGSTTSRRFDGWCRLNYRSGDRIGNRFRPLLFFYPEDFQAQ